MTPIQELDQYFADNGLERIQFHGTEYAWGYRENEPIIALIYGLDPGMAFQTAMSLYWASADYISKPWCLIMDSAMVAPPQREMIENLATQYNIQIASESELLDTVKTQSKKLIKLLEVYAPDGSLVSLGESIRGWKTVKPAYEYSYDVEVETGDLDMYKEGKALEPSRKTIPLTAVSGETRIEGILPRLVRVEVGLFFDTEHRNLPIVFKLSICEKSCLVARFEADKANITEATNFWALHQSFLVSKKLAFIEPNTGDNMFNCVMY